MPADLERTRALVRRAQGGDCDALNTLCVRYDGRVRRIVRVRLGTGLRRWTESGDVVQDVFREALRKIESLDPASEFDLLDWLARVATNRIRDLVDHVGAEKRDVARQESVAAADDGESEAPPFGVDEHTGPGEAAFLREVRALLDEVVAALPESYREVILLRDYQGADWPDVARLLGTPSLHAAQQLHQRAWIKARALAEPRLAGLRRG